MNFTLETEKCPNAADQERQAITGLDLISIHMTQVLLFLCKISQTISAKYTHIPKMAKELCSVPKVGVLWGSVNRQCDSPVGLQALVRGNRKNSPCMALGI